MRRVSETPWERGTSASSPGKDAYTKIPIDVAARVEVSTSAATIPDDCVVIIATSHKVGVMGERKRLLDKFGAGANGEAPFDVLFVDEAWQLPPIEIGNNPWRGDPGYNPYRAWPTEYDNDPKTWTAELPAVWRR